MTVLYRIVLLGEGGVGKTAITMQFCLNNFIESYDPTIEDSYRKQTVIDSEACLLEILDTAGQEEFMALRDQWIRDGDGFLLVYSMTSRATFEHIEQLKEHIVRSKESDKIAICILANKCDRIGEIEVNREEGQALAKKLNAGYLETSAKTGINIEKAFVEIVRKIRRLNGDDKRNEGDSRAGKKRRVKCVIL